MKLIIKLNIMYHLTKSEFEKKLSVNPELTIPRSVKLLRLCLEDWLSNEKSEFSPIWLLNFCQAKAGINGENAFMRALMALLGSLQKEEDFLRLNNFASENCGNCETKKIFGNIIRRLENADERLINSFQAYLLH